MEPTVPEFVESNQAVKVKDFVFNSKDGVEDVAELIFIPGFAVTDFGNFAQYLVKMHHSITLNKQLMQSDGIHPTAEAQPIILDNVWPELEPMLEETYQASSQ